VVANSSKKPLQKVLYGVLNWGLGHGTRSIPIIRQLCLTGVEVEIASDGATADILQKEFPHLRHHSLPAYRIQYARNPLWFPIKLMCQIPGLMNTIRQEKNWLFNHLAKNEYDLIISDNRYGFYDSRTPSVIITHQLNIQSPLGKNCINQWLETYLKRFNSIWVPDFQNRLSGELSKSKLNSTIDIGWWSAYHKKETKKDIDVLILLSGPEPQRTVLELELCKVKIHKPNIVLVRGTNQKPETDFPAEWEVKDLLAPAELNDLLLRSNKIVSSSGYSSLMDFKTLGLPAVLIPTPGQTEQEYLSVYLGNEREFKSIRQKEVQQKISSALDNLKSPKTKSPGNSAEALFSAVNQLGFSMPT
jgi:hypothetical protein